MAQPNQQKLVLIDGNSLLYRAFFALPPLTNAAGEQTGAVYGFTTMLFKLLDDEQPDLLAVAFDLPAPTFRHAAYAEYKATRQAMPDGLSSQIAMAREILDAMHLPTFDFEGYEADDIIGTLATKAAAAGAQVLIVTGDLDELQLVSDRIRVLVTRRGVSDSHLYDRAAVEERYGFGPEKLPDFKALRGDPSDNIPGVPGIGEKTAGALIKKYGTLEEVLAHAEEVTPPRIGAALTAHAVLAERSKELSLIVCTLPLEPDSEELRVREPDRKRLLELFRHLDFRSLAARLAAGAEMETAADFHTVSDPAAASELAVRLQEAGEFFVHPIADDAPGLRATLYGLAFLVDNEAYVVMEDGPGLATVQKARSHQLSSPSGPLSIFAEGEGGQEVENAAHEVDPRPEAFPFPPRGDGEGGQGSEGKQRERGAVRVNGVAAGLRGALLIPLRPVFESPDLRKVGHDLKRLGLILSQYDIGLQGIHFDTMLASYLTDPARKHDLASACYEYLQVEPEGKLKPEEARAPGRAALTVRRLAQLRTTLEDYLTEREQWWIFHHIEMPLLPVLLEMERTGIAIDVEALDALSSRLAERIRELEVEIYARAGEEFNISSPQQLQRILFEKLGLAPDRRRRTKTGYSTGADVLAALSDHEIVAHILEYRELTKLKGTYIDALPKLVNPRTGRVHTSFNQAVTATGRLSSSDPNLQNIPVRREQGAEVRRAFVPGRPGELLLSADYSQIELRILAHITRDEHLIEVFRRDEDLHWAAAQEIFGVTAENGTPEMRAFAKTINFGVTYGMSEARLARDLGVSAEEAHAYIERYFNRFPRVRAYIEQLPAEAASRGYVLTVLGRRRDLPELRARAPMVRQAAERMAVNTPMQGTAADIMKLAMLKVQAELHARKLRTRLLLQVHDELLLEVPKEELKEAARLVCDCMMHAYDLVVPLKVDLKVGGNWLDMVASPVADSCPAGGTG